jgi:K+-sensing histidine kinase KdpD
LRGRPGFIPACVTSAGACAPQNEKQQTGGVMRETVELLASAIHDAKNQLFFAENAVATIAAEHSIDGSAVLNAIELAAERLTRALLAYQLSSGDMRPSISAVTVNDLIEDLGSIHQARLTHQGLVLELSCDVDSIWPLDRDLVIDTLNNTIQNAARYARSRIALSAQINDGRLLLRVEDDGPGFAASSVKEKSCTGLGLHIGDRIAHLHERRGRRGELNSFNGGRFGGAVTELNLP